MPDTDLGPYSNYRLTVRLALKNRPGVFAGVTALLARRGANLGAVDIVDATALQMVRDLTFDVANEAHGEDVIEALRHVRGVKVISWSDQVFLAHLGGKIHVENKFPVKTRNRLSTVYTPGVARVSQAIAADPGKAYALTIKRNTVAVVSDGSAVLGLGNLGAAAAVPVMEGKAMLFKQFANIDAWPICLDTQDVEEIVQTVKRIAPVFGGINLEDISAPRCFQVEERLRRELDIPVMHDDQHGTAIVVLAALKNALRIVGKDIRRIRVVVNGMGAAGVACCRILLGAGVRHLTGLRRSGVVLRTGTAGHAGRASVSQLKRHFFEHVQWEHPQGTLRDALSKADVFIGVSQGNILGVRELRLMAKDRIVFALANPDPEVDPARAAKHCRIFATGRSDLSNQINNALAFPGVFRGALDVRAREINEPMKIAAADAIARLISREQLHEEYIIPSIFDQRVVGAVSEAVARAAIRSGVARKTSLAAR